MTKPQVLMWPSVVYECKQVKCTNTFKRMSGNDRAKVYCSDACRAYDMKIKIRENMRVVSYMEKTMPNTLIKLRAAMHEAVRTDAIPITKKRRSDFYNAKQRTG